MKKIIIISAVSGACALGAAISIPLLINKWKTRGKSETKSSDGNQDVPAVKPSDPGTENPDNPGNGGDTNLPAPVTEDKPKVDVICSSSTTEYKGHVYGCLLSNLTAEPVQVTVSPIVTKHQAVTFEIPARRSYSFFSDTETFKLAIGDSFKSRVTKVLDKELQYSGAN